MHELHKNGIWKPYTKQILAKNSEYINIILSSPKHDKATKDFIINKKYL